MGSGGRHAHGSRDAQIRRPAAPMSASVWLLISGCPAAVCAACACVWGRRGCCLRRPPLPTVLVGLAPSVTAALMIATGDGEGQVRGDGGALAGGGPDLEPAAERCQPVGHV